MKNILKLPAAWTSSSISLSFGICVAASSWHVSCRNKTVYLFVLFVLFVLFIIFASCFIKSPGNIFDHLSIKVVDLRAS